MTLSPTTRLPLSDVEEVGRPQMVISVGLAGVDRGDLDGAIGPRCRQVLADLERAFELLELAADGGDPQVLDGKANAGMNRVDDPGSGGYQGDAGRHS